MLLGGAVYITLFIVIIMSLAQHPGSSIFRFVYCSCLCDIFVHDLQDVFPLFSVSILIK